MGETNDTTLTSEQEYAVLLKFLRKQNLKVGFVVCVKSVGSGNGGQAVNDLFY